SERLQTKTARLLNRTLANGADCAGHYRDAIPAIIRPSIEIEAASVFQGLAPCDERAQVSNFGVARDSADAFIGKRSEQTWQCVALPLCVSTDQQDDTVMHGCETPLQGARFAAFL